MSFLFFRNEEQTSLDVRMPYFNHSCAKTLPLTTPTD